MDNRTVGEKRSREDRDFRPTRKLQRGNRPNASSLAEAIKCGQRVSKGWKEAWSLWVSAQPNPNGFRRPPPNDPNRWPQERLKEFFEEIGRFFVGGSGPGEAPFHGGREAPFHGGREAPFHGGHTPFHGGPSGPPNFSSFLGPKSPRESQPPNFPEREWSPRNGPQPPYMAFNNARMGPPPPARGRGFSNPALVDLVKAGQRNKEGFKDTWRRFCTEHGGGTMDPRMHPVPFFVGFSMYYGVERLGKEEWAQPFLSALGNAGSPILIQIIKKGQRESEKWKQQWSKFCNESAGARKDPALHEPRSLFQFVGDVGVTTYGEKELMKRLFEANVP